MTLTREQIHDLLRLIDLTREQEIDCDECLSRIAEFVERELSGKSVSGALEAVRHHLQICPECREEYEVLQRAIETIG